MVLAAARAGKDIYLEKPLCMTVEEAKELRAAVRQHKVVPQLGHNRNSAPSLHKAHEVFRSGRLGNVPLVRTYIDRALARPPWKFYSDSQILELPKDASPATIDWERFLAGKPKRPFDPEQFFRWRGWWDCSTGVAGDLMSHLWDSVNMIVGMGIPDTALTHGALYQWKNDIHVPDMWRAIFDYPRRELTVTFHRCFHNSHYGDVVQLLGRDGTMEAGPQFCRVYGAERKAESQAKLREARRKGNREAGLPQEYLYKDGEIEVSTHWQDFIECVRTRRHPNPAASPSAFTPIPSATVLSTRPSPRWLSWVSRNATWAEPISSRVTRGRRKPATRTILRADRTPRSSGASRWPRPWARLPWPCPRWSV